jgi:hypothetical protein
MAQLPHMFKLKQTFPRPLVTGIPEITKQELLKLGLEKRVFKGQKIGITVGSRGIQNLIPILQTTINHLKALGVEPCLLAAMGSHGNGLTSGQKEVLDSLGITENSLHAPVVTCADCETIAHTASGLPVFIVKSALTLDGILVVNRVKTHTSFKGKLESGLIKELVVGLGGPKGAQHFHCFGPGELQRLLVEIGEVILSKLPILGGLAIVENAYEETAVIQGTTKEGMIDHEAELLSYSKSLMPTLPADDIDLLIIQEMGKNFSGTGIDTNIIGRARIHGVPEPSKPTIKRIAVLDLSEESHGNATGVGMADFVSQKLVDKIDRKATYLNCLTSTFVVRAAIPMYFETEEKMIDAALYSLAGIPAKKLRVVIIPNTLFLENSYISEALVTDIKNKPGSFLDQKPQQLTFDAQGSMSLRI